MTDHTLEDEIRELAEQVAAGPDDVAEFGAIHARAYREQRAVVLGMLQIDAMLAGDQREIDERHPSLVALRLGLRDRLGRLLAWARRTERL